MKDHNWYSARVDELLRLLDDARRDAAAASRRRGRALDAAAAESATLVGVLVDLHELGAHVTVATADAGAHRGAVRLVGADFVIVGTGAGDVWIAISGITSITG